MEKVIILNNSAYAAVSSGAAIATIKDADRLAKGAMAFFDKNGDLVSLTSTDQVETLYMAFRNNERVRISKALPVKSINRLNYGAYQAPVMNKVVVGGTTAADRLPIEATDVGHVGLSVSDQTFTSIFATNYINASVYKKSYMTVEQVVDKLVDNLNKATNLNVVAAKIGAAGNFGITIESTVRGQVLTLTASGLIEGAKLVTDGTGASQLPFPGAGVGEDVVEAEKQSLIYIGDGNYTEKNDLMFNRDLGAEASSNYNSINFVKELDTPYRGETNTKPLYSIYGTSTLVSTINDFLVAQTDGPLPTGV